MTASYIQFAVPCVKDALEAMGRATHSAVTAIMDPCAVYASPYTSALVIGASNARTE